MSKDHEENDYEDESDFLEAELGDAYDLDFNDSKAMKKQHRAITRRETRNRLEDYFERKALKEKMDDWDFDLDYDY